MKNQQLLATKFLILIQQKLQLLHHEPTDIKFSKRLSCKLLDFGPELIFGLQVGSFELFKMRMYISLIYPTVEE